MGTVPDYFASRFIVASNQPLLLNSQVLRERLAGVDLAASFNPEQQRRLVEFFAGQPLQPLRQRRKVLELPDEQFNHDLHPRDEYFLNDD
jgi:hypothetical protein